MRLRILLIEKSRKKSPRQRMGYSTSGVGIVKIIISIQVEVIFVAPEPRRPIALPPWFSHCPFSAKASSRSCILWLLWISKAAVAEGHVAQRYSCKECEDKTWENNPSLNAFRQPLFPMEQEGIVFPSVQKDSVLLELVFSRAPTALLNVPHERRRYC